MSKENLIDRTQFKNYLKDKGIDSLDSFIEKTLPTLSKEEIAMMKIKENQEDLLVDNELLKKVFIKEQSPPKKQKPVLIPFQVNDTIYDPKDVNVFDGKNLHFYVDNEMLEKTQLKAFTTNKDLIKFLVDREIMDGDFTERIKNNLIPIHHVSGMLARFYQHSKYRGKRFDLSYRHAVWCFKEHRMSGWGPWKKNWNDQISSIKSYRNLRVFEHCELKGRSLYIRRNTNIPHLSRFWNDRISSAIGAS